MIRIKPEQDVTKRKAGVFRVYNLFKSSAFHISLNVCVFVCVRVHVCVCVCVCVCVSMIILRWGRFLHCWKCATSFLSMCSALFLILRMNSVNFLCGVSSNKIIQNAKPSQK